MRRDFWWAMPSGNSLERYCSVHDDMGFCSLRELDLVGFLVRRARMNVSVIEASTTMAYSDEYSGITALHRTVRVGANAPSKDSLEQKLTVFCDE